MCYQMIVIWWGIWEDGGKDTEKTNDKSSLGSGGKSEKKACLLEEGRL